MTAALFLLLRLICYGALAVAALALFALILVLGSRQCPPLSMQGVTCATGFFQALADLVLAIADFSLSNALPIPAALGGLTFLVYDVRRLLRADRR
jgi:hypothetical protein